MKLRVARRLLQIQRVLVRHGLDDYVRATHLYRPLRFLFFLSPWTWFQRRRGATRAERLRLALEELGPIFVKFGQALSTRRDLLPVDIADELARLQDRVPPFPGELARASLERSYGRRLEELFTAFATEALAAASIAQVHVATRRDGREVVVKVLRPGMRAQIGRDLEVLDAIAALAERWWPEARRLRPIEVVREYRQTVLDELDLMREAANASQLRRNFAHSPLLYVPEVHWDLCRGEVMVMERIHGVPIGDLATLRARGTDFRRLAENGVEIFFTQVFRHNFFHADMHPGNIFVIVDEPAAPRYAAVDFGIVGTLAMRDQRYLAEIFLAVFDRDYRRVAELHIECGWVPPATRVEEMESAVRTICEPIFDRPLREISFGTVLLRLFAALRRFDGQIQPQLILLQKTLLNVEGLGRQLYPELDIWKTASPVLRAWKRERVSPRTLLRELRRGLPDVLEVLTSLPALARVAIERAQSTAARPRDAGLPTERPDAPYAAAAAALAAATAASADAAVRRREQFTVAATILAAGLLWLGLRIEPQWPGAVGAAGGMLGLIALLFRT
ncbi:MAG: ubiquinone biosynthesis regulatory protein kinase UbiB [Gammaproteobacteria bacterium]|nr:ubiquinone biosynthesis regulatory protein kinase UbiB [Gammaproteobacteria bacterium]